MRRKSLTPLGETEMEVLHHVWQLGEATVADVREQIQQTRDVAYTTVMTVMKNLADKGYLTYEKEGKTYVYAPARPPEEVRHSLLRGIMEKVFKGSPSALVQTLVEHETLSEEERAEIRQLLESLEDDDASNR
jgi:predicted transcriptional regulator